MGFRKQKISIKMFKNKKKGLKAPKMVLGLAEAQGNFPCKLYLKC